MPLIAAILGASASVKVAYAAALTLATSSTVLATEIFGQIEGGGANTTAATLIPATALTATSGALVWVVKQIAGGNLVHRDPATSEAALAETVARLADIASKAIEREKVLTDLLISDRTNSK